MAPVWLKILRWIKMTITIAVILGCTPPFYFIWFGWRIITIFHPPDIYARGDDFLYHVFQSFVLFFIENVNRTKVILHGDAQALRSRKEKVLYMSNHQCYMDWIVANLVGSRQSSMGQVRFVLKDVLQFIPFYGFCNYLHGMVYINRDSFDSKKMLTSLDYLRNKKIPSWVVIFPEGTFYEPNSPKSIEKSRRYAEDQGLAPFERVLFPRHRGVSLILGSLRDNLDALYDVTLVYSYESESRTGVRENACSLSDFFLKGCESIHIHVNRVPINEVPKKTEDLKQFLIERFRKKDELLRVYFDNMTSLPKGHPLSHGIKSPPRTISNCIIFLFFIILTLSFLLSPVGRTLYTNGVIYGVPLGYLWLFTSHIFSAVTEKLLHTTKMLYSSSVKQKS